MTNQDTTSIDEQIDEIFTQFLKNDPWTLAEDELEEFLSETKANFKALISDQVAKARIEELGQLMPPLADMIPEWEWPCYVCGFDRDLLRKHIEDRIATLNGVKK